MTQDLKTKLGYFYPSNVLIKLKYEVKQHIFECVKFFSSALIFLCIDLIIHYFFVCFVEIFVFIHAPAKQLSLDEIGVNGKLFPGRLTEINVPPKNT